LGIIQNSINNNVVWEPQPRQSVLLRCPADERFFGGAKGGGKTDAALGDWLKQMKLATDLKLKARGIFFRRSYSELEEAIYRSQQFYPLLGAKWKDAKKIWIFPWGELKMKFIERDADAMKYQGHSYQWICMDELGNYPTPFAYNNMMSCLRSAEGVPARFLSTGNPGGPGQSWIKRRFISGKTPDYIYTYKNKIVVKGKERDVEMTRCFIPSFVSDNKYWEEKDPGYFARLAGLPEHLRKAYLDGNWDVSIGQAFPDITDNHKVEPFQIPYDWKRFATMDWGFTKPFSMGFWAVSPIGRLYRIGEYYGCPEGMEDEGLKLDAKTAGKKFVELTNALAIDHTYGDPACWARHGHGSTIADIMDSAGLRLIPADRDRVTAKQTFHSMLQDTLDDGDPAFQVFSTCTQWWRTVPNLVSDKNNIEDVDTRGEDHIYDDTRFAIMSPEVIRGIVSKGHKRNNYAREDVDYAR